MAMGEPAYGSATPAGIMRLLRHYEIPLQGKHAVVIGRSPILGKPIAMMLLNANATVTICHSKTQALSEIIRSADIVVGAVGIPVKWEDIDGAGAIIELRNAALQAEPSHGSHFFQQITTNGLPYLTIDEQGDDFVRWPRIEQFQVVQETEFLCHARVPAPLLIKCNGRSSQCVVLGGGPD